MAISKASIQASRKLDAILKAYDFHDHQHAIAILTVDFPELLCEICDVLSAFRIRIDQIKKAGGNESEISKALSLQLRPLGWKEQKLRVKLKVGGQTLVSAKHNIDYVKGKVAFDFEWRSKNQTFDRDLYAFRHVMRKRGVVVKTMLSRRAPNMMQLGSRLFGSDRGWHQQYFECPTLFVSSINLRRRFHDHNITI